MNSLVVAPQWLGDAVMCEPLLRRLAARGERVSVGCLPHLAAVFEAMPHVAEVLPWDLAHGRLDWAARRRIASGLKIRFSRAYVLPNSIKSALIPWLAGIPERIGRQGEGRWGLLSQRLPNPPQGQRPAMVPFYSALAGSGDCGDAPQLQVSSGQTEAFLSAHSLTRNAYRVFAPGSEYGSAKRWPAGHFRQLAQSLIANDGLPIVLLGSAKETGIGAEIAQNLPQVLDLTGKTPLAQALIAIAASKFIVSNDSGLMHVAAGLGRPQVAIYGSSSPEHTPPLNPAAQFIWLKSDVTYQPALDCAPCFDRECRFGHTRCLADVGAEQVLKFAVAACSIESAN